MTGNMVNVVMKKRKVLVFYLVVTVILITVMGILFHMNVESRSKARALFDNSMYKEKELAYQQQVRQTLSDWSMGDSGMMLTHITDLNGDRTYRMEIHNCRWDLLSMQDAALLYESISSIAILNGNHAPVEIEVVITK